MAKNFTTADADFMQNRVNALGNGTPVPKKAAAESIGKMFIEQALKTSGVRYKKEHQFSDERKFRFDFCFWINRPSRDVIKIAIEYEGIFSPKSRHTSFNGYTRDTTKYNLAALDGWVVLRYTAKSYKEFVNDLSKLMR